MKHTFDDLNRPFSLYCQNRLAKVDFPLKLPSLLLLQGKELKVKHLFGRDYQKSIEGILSSVLVFPD